MLSIGKKFLNQLKAQNKLVYPSDLAHKPYVRTIASLENNDAEKVLKSIDAQSDNYEKLTVLELKVRLRSQGLLTAGSKSVLVERLKSPNENDYAQSKKGSCSISRMTIIELREKLMSQGLITVGNKAALVERLKSPNEKDYIKNQTVAIKPSIRKVQPLKKDKEGEKPFDSLNVIELRTMLRYRGLKKTGIKSELKERLLESMDAKGDEDEDLDEGIAESLTEERQQRVLLSLQRLESSIGEEPASSQESDKNSAILMPDEISSYEELNDVTVKLIESIGLCENLKSTKPEEYLYFRALFQYHKDAERKKVALITDIHIRRSPQVSMFKKDLQVGDYQMTIVTSDGEEDTISWVKLMRNKTFEQVKISDIYKRRVQNAMKNYNHEDVLDVESQR